MPCSPDVRAPPPAPRRSPVPAGWDPELRPATRPEFGHFQTNLPVRSAKPLGLPPREIGDRLLAGAGSGAGEVLGGRGRGLDGPGRDAVARAVGIGAVEYADLVDGLGRD